VRQGKALYAGISNYNPEQAKRAIEILDNLGTPCLIHQPKYSMFVRDPEDGLLDVLGKKGVGCIAYSPLAQGLLTNRYLKGIPGNSRAGREGTFLSKEEVTPEAIGKVHKLNDIAAQRNQSLAQMAIAWLLKDERLTSVLVGASSSAQLRDSLFSLNNMAFTKDELEAIENVLKG
jgi:L-glyceraldehyde 3-phosphate reductase